MNGSVKWKKGLSFTGQADSGFQVSLGASPSVGGVNDGFRPLELMAVSLAGCTAMYVISILTKKRQPVSGFSVTVQTTQSSEHPKVFTQILILYQIMGHDVEETAVRRAIELSATTYCPAQAMLGKVIPMELVYEIENDDGKISRGKIVLIQQ
jgi:putative redox protein